LSQFYALAQHFALHSPWRARPMAGPLADYSN